MLSVLQVHLVMITQNLHNFFKIIYSRNRRFPALRPFVFCLYWLLTTGYWPLTFHPSFPPFPPAHQDGPGLAGILIGEFVLPMPFEKEFSYLVPIVQGIDHEMSDMGRDSFIESGRVHV